MGTVAPLPVWRSVAEIYGFIASRPRDLVRVGWLPLVLLVALSLALGTFRPKQPPEIGGWADVQPVLADWLLGALLQGAVAVLVLVAWHRLVMRVHGQPVDSRQARRLSVPGRPELLYLVQMLGLSVLFLAVFAAAALVCAVMLHLAVWLATGGGPTGADRVPVYVGIGYAAILLGLLPAFYVALRLSLALPETAVSDQRGRFARSWTATRGNGWRMAAVTVLAMVPVEIISIGLSFAAQSSYGSAAYFPAVSAACLGLLMLMVVLGSALTKCYLALGRPVPVHEALGVPEPAS